MIRGTIEVHLTGDGFGLSDLIGPLAVVVAAGLAVLFARFNLREQLAHDRFLRARAETRRVIDQAAEEATRVIVESSRAKKAETLEARLAALQPAIAASYEVSVLRTRLVMHLVHSDPVVQTYTTLDKALDSHLARIHDLPAGPHVVMPEDTIVDVAYGSFLKACRAWAELDPPDRPIRLLGLLQPIKRHREADHPVDG